MVTRINPALVYYRLLVKIEPQNVLKNQTILYNTSGTFPASPGSFLKKIYINMTINIIHILSNVVKISSNIKK